MGLSILLCLAIRKVFVASLQIVGYLIHRTTQCLLNSIHRKLKSSTFVPLVEKSVPHHLWPPRSERLEDHCPAYDPESSSHRLHRPISFLIGHQGPEGAPRDRKKQKNIKHNGDITFDEVVSIARTMRFRS